MSMRSTAGISKAAKCTAAISTQYTLATFGADDDTFSVASGSTQSLVGIFQGTTVNAGDSAEVMISGISNIVLGGTVSRGQELTSDANGNGIAVASWPQASGVFTIGVALESGVAGDIIAVLLEPDFMQPMAPKTVVALADAAATLTAAQMVGDGLFTITPSAARALTTDTAANIVAALPGAQVGGWFDFTIVCEAAYAATLTAGSGVTVTGVAAANNNSASFRVVLTNVTGGTEAVTIYRL